MTILLMLFQHLRLELKGLEHGLRCFSYNRPLSQDSSSVQLFQVTMVRVVTRLSG